MTPLRTAPPGTVAAALAEAAPLGSFFALTVGGPDTGWRPVGDAYAAGVPDLVDAVARRHAVAEMRIAASIAQLGHAARLWSPVLFCAVAHGVLPDLDGLQKAEDGAALRLPAPRGHRLPRDGDRAGALYHAVVTRHLDRLAAGLRVKVAPGLLYGNAASALVEAARAILAARPDLRDDLTGLLGELLRTGRLDRTGRVVSPEPAFRRRSCCLYHRAPAGRKCGDCSLARPDERPADRR
ncbi:(2Fe-2S)-binding protein [Actinomadura sp. WMMB 499]|uniref:(2Fe-2S)-binding protein n=1 Tax=Actinomadura sp. WMMB 499 TaxID=1219491 RepID=UPI001246B775|nr:(2Fe-2S)-binding protein [Actinomadura sp. WMMB 499]QFG26239.1 (2Fe-2S)-binding protein [Actinomadura sp. WMMB 499]